MVRFQSRKTHQLFILSCSVNLPDSLPFPPLSVPWFSKEVHGQWDLCFSDVLWPNQSLSQSRMEPEKLEVSLTKTLFLLFSLTPLVMLTAHLRNTAPPSLASTSTDPRIISFPLEPKMRLSVTRFSQSTGTTR